MTADNEEQGYLPDWLWISVKQVDPPTFRSIIYAATKGRIVDGAYVPQHRTDMTTVVGPDHA